jgi:CheY-like chemotaxis protein
VLVVHADEATRAVVREALELEGYRAVAADHPSVPHVLAALGGAPAAVLLDLHGDAAAVLGALAARYGASGMPVVALTTAPDALGPDALTAGGVVGADGAASADGVHTADTAVSADGARGVAGTAALLREPFELDELLACVRRVCGAGAN